MSLAVTLICNRVSMALGRRGQLIAAGMLVASAAVFAQEPATATADQDPPQAVFKSSVDLVRVAAVVRDRKGHFVQDLTSRDFEVLDGGERRPISDFRRDLTGVSIAFLFDVSGSMEVSQKIAFSREAATHVLSWLEPDRDEAAVFTFDTQLNQIMPFTSGVKTLPTELDSIRPFGATSLHDAIAATAERVGSRQGRRRAVVVFTDGNDNWSRLTPGQVSGLASSIDVPVYVFGIVPPIDDPAADIAGASAERSSLAGPLSDLATWTGGHVFVASSPAQRSLAARQIVDELRHQYLIAFESSGKPGWHPLVVRMRTKDLTVRARSGYIAGQSRPTVF
jgi:Ca-activated chloride channel homolog